MKSDPFDRSQKFPREPEGETREPGARSENITHRVSNVVSKTKSTVIDVAHSASGTLNRQRETAADGLKRFASTIHGKAEGLPGGPKTASLAHGIADRMESTATYLRNHDFGTMRDDAMAACRRHPAQALISAVVVGFLLGRVIRR
jgi:hypothetical protein